MVDLELPRMFKLRQVFPPTTPVNIRQTVEAEMAWAVPRIKRGQRIAVGVGSRGITNLRSIVAEVLAWVRQQGGEPFIVPAMGSHGGATAEGQVSLLGEYGITEVAMRAPIRASMLTRDLGITSDGVKVNFSAEALDAEGILLINRIKPHTDFTANIGSGLMKMLVVGLGKREGAVTYHQASSVHGYERVLRTIARFLGERVPVLGGLAIVENHRHDTAHLRGVPLAELEEAEASLFAEARRLMPKLPFDEIDLLIVDRLGKNISGAGMDPNIIGRSIHGYSALLEEQKTRPVVRRLYVRGLTPESHGNATGIGMADFTTTRLVREMDYAVTVLNGLTALSVQSSKIPIHFERDAEVLTRALRTLPLRSPDRARIVRIADTLSLEYLQVSEAYLAEVGERADLVVESPLAAMGLDAAGNLGDL